MDSKVLRALFTHRILEETKHLLEGAEESYHKAVTDLDPDQLKEFLANKHKTEEL